MSASSIHNTNTTSQAGFPPAPSEALQRANGLPPIGDEWADCLDDEVVDLIAASPDSRVAQDCLKVIWQADCLIGLLPDVMAMPARGPVFALDTPNLIRCAAAYQCSVLYFG